MLATMNTTQSDPDGPVPVPPASSRSGRTRRVVTSVAVSAVLLGSGAAVGIALTGGASAAAGSGNGTAAAPSASSALAARHQCAQLVLGLLGSGHPAAARRVLALCHVPLLRLAAVGGVHGDVTFETKSGPKTLAFERGTVEYVTSSAITVKAPDGTTWTWDLTASTAIRSAGQKVAESQLGTGDLVFVGGPVVNGVNDARLIRIRGGS
jgi:hypothetical protein